MSTVYDQVLWSAVAAFVTELIAWCMLRDVYFAVPLSITRGLWHGRTHWVPSDLVELTFSRLCLYMTKCRLDDRPAADNGAVHLCFGTSCQVLVLGFACLQSEQRSPFPLLLLLLFLLLIAADHGKVVHNC